MVYSDKFMPCNTQCSPHLNVSNRHSYQQQIQTNCDIIACACLLIRNCKWERATILLPLSLCVINSEYHKLFNHHFIKQNIFIAFILLNLMNTFLLGFLLLLCYFCLLFWICPQPQFVRMYTREYFFCKSCCKASSLWFGGSICSQVIKQYAQIKSHL